jgi:P27 family predicted phage terminase small subunit
MSKPKWIAQPNGIEGRALKIWNSYASWLHSEGRLTRDNEQSFRALCRTLAVGEAASAEIERDGATIKSYTGTVRAHPAVKMVLDAQRNAEPLLAIFGLNTAARHSPICGWQVKCV